jgi:hypothetical protein
MPKRTNRTVDTPAAHVPVTPLGKMRKWKVPVRVDVTYLGHVVVDARSADEAADVVFDMKDRTLKDLGSTVYSTESKSYVEGVGMPL